MPKVNFFFQCQCSIVLGNCSEAGAEKQRYFCCACGLSYCSEGMEGGAVRLALFHPWDFRCFQTDGQKAMA